jgi:hypothetical protein
MEKNSSNVVFLAWLEFPYFIGVNYESSFPATYNPGVEVNLHIKFRNDLLRVRTSNRWTNSDYREKQIRGLIDDPKQQVFCVPRYLTEANLDMVAELVKKHDLPYLHVERPETVVELRAEFETSLNTDEALTGIHSIIADLLPGPTFFNKQVLPRLLCTVEAYRVATLPAVRFSIHPVSESLISTAFIEIQDGSGRIIQQADYGIDLRGHNRFMQDHVENLGVQSRFDAFLTDPASIAVESQFCSSYYLFHMRRWAEAVTIASGVVDTLIRKIIFSNLAEPLASLLWRKHRTQTQDLFNQILPAVGYSKLADIDQTLWKAFKEAKSYRGSAAHGSVVFPFDHDEEKKAEEHLTALYSVARWLSIQSGRSWALDVEENGKLLPFF